MFGVKFASKPLQYVPLLTSKRWTVRIFPTPDHEPSDRGEDPKKPRVKTSTVNIFSFLHRENLTWNHFKNWKKWKRIEAMKADQSYLPDRHRTLGPDLATTHFITIRGGKIKFVGSEKWIVKDDVEQKKVPNVYKPGFYVEEVDASGLDLLYEAFDNLCSLTKLKKLHLRNCRYIDDWCLNRNHLFANTLEHLDISGCNLVTERGICSLHSLKKLKTLVINDTPNIQNKELVTLLLQDIIPECEIIGVSYNDPVFLKRLEHFMN